ncbi:outer membrane protein [Glacieibacterium sp.]|uniref:outer membrane protein n=1 Tax=Glacieibacterium sp. TaxID=2860237 RepID=UPI003B00BBFF
MKNYTLAALAALIAVPSIAAAAEPFNGAFVGVQGGWQQDKQRLSLDNVDGSSSRYGDKKDGFAYGGQLGFDTKVTPQIVLGVEASATGRTGSTRFDDGVGDAFRLKQGRTLNATARAGYLVSPLGLLYVRGGYTNAQFRINNGFDSAHDNRGGYTAGVGYEQFLTKQVSARVEYNYSHFGRDSIDNVGDLVAADNAAVRYNRNAVSAGLNLHF